jgi:hypothetical protein
MYLPLYMYTPRGPFFRLAAEEKSPPDAGHFTSRNAH